MPDALSNVNPDLGASTAKISLLHQHARALAQAGIKVFPCRPEEKLPATAHRFRDATCDLVQIDRWWADKPNYNLAICPEDQGWCVLDPDCEEGKDAWAKLCGENGVAPDTYEVETPRGGRHLYFGGSLPSTAGKLAPHVDTRGRGGYVLVPPSVVNGKPYRVLRDRDLAILPAWIGERLATAHRAKPRATRTGDKPDFPGSVERARAHLNRLVERGDVAVEGQGGDSRTYKLACEVIGLGCSEATAVDLIAERWDPHCVPPWGPDGIAAKVDCACSYMQEDQGHLLGGSSGSAAETFKDYAERAQAAMDAQGDGRALNSRYAGHKRGEYRDRPPVTLLIEGLYLPQAGLGMLAADSQSFKSFIALEIVLAVSTGRPAFGTMPVNMTGTAIYAAGEGSRGIEDQRLPAYEIDAGDGLDLNDFPFQTIRALPAAATDAEVDQFIAAVRAVVDAEGQPLRFIVLDTLNKMMPGADENAAGVMAQTLRVAERLIEAHCCFVLILHHFGKDKSRGPRGSSATFAALDWCGTVEPTKDKDRHLYLADLDIAKDQDGDGEGEHVYLRGIRVDLGHPEQKRNHSLVMRQITKDQFTALAGGRDGETAKELDVTPGKLGAALKDLRMLQSENQNVSLSQIVDYFTEPMEVPPGAAGFRRKKQARDRIRAALWRGRGGKPKVDEKGKIEKGHNIRFAAYVVPGTADGKSDDLYFWFPDLDIEAKE